MNLYNTNIFRLVLLGTLSLFTIRAQGRRAIPEDNLRYPVLLTLKEHGLASGFYLSDDSHIYLVTARHVLFKELKDPKQSYALKAAKATCLSYPKDPNDLGRIKLELNLQNLNKKKLIKAL